jgi:DNA-binding LytR/AlgR family response regulator
MNIVLIDYDSFYINELKKRICKILKANCINYDIHSFYSGMEFLNSNKCYDLIFMNFEMPKLNGIDTIKRYQEKHSKGLVIFFSENMEVMQMGYIVKAFRFLERGCYDEKFQEAVKSAVSNISGLKKVIITSTGGEDIILEHRDIVYIEAADRGTKLVILEGVVCSKRKISDLAQELTRSCFYQTHRAFIVNLNYVLYYEKRDVFLRGNNVVPLSVKRINEFREVYYNWKIGDLPLQSNRCTSLPWNGF